MKKSGYDPSSNWYMQQYQQPVQPQRAQQQQQKWPDSLKFLVSTLFKHSSSSAVLKQQIGLLLKSYLQSLDMASLWSVDWLELITTSSNSSSLFCKIPGLDSLLDKSSLLNIQSDLDKHRPARSVRVNSSTSASRDEVSFAVPSSASTDDKSRISSSKPSKRRESSSVFDHHHHQPSQKQPLKRKADTHELDANEKRKMERAKRFSLNPASMPTSSKNSTVASSQQLEKPYLRLTSAPDMSQVRPLRVLRRSLDMIKNRWKDDIEILKSKKLPSTHAKFSEKEKKALMGNSFVPPVFSFDQLDSIDPLEKQNLYAWCCDQLKSIRQDLTVQFIRNRFTVEVYEYHARLALEMGDLSEFNQCQCQLIGQQQSVSSSKGSSFGSLYSHLNIPWSEKKEFLGYRLLYFVYTSNHSAISQFLQMFNGLIAQCLEIASSNSSHKDPLLYALKVRSMIAAGNFNRLMRPSIFSLGKECPNLGSLVLVSKMVGGSFVGVYESKNVHNVNYLKFNRYSGHQASNIVKSEWFKTLLCILKAMKPRMLPLDYLSEQLGFESAPTNGDMPISNKKAKSKAISRSLKNFLAEILLHHSSDDSEKSRTQIDKLLDPFIVINDLPSSSSEIPSKSSRSLDCKKFLQAISSNR